MPGKTEAPNWGNPVSASAPEQTTVTVVNSAGVAYRSSPSFKDINTGLQGALTGQDLTGTVVIPDSMLNASLSFSVSLPRFTLLLHTCKIILHPGKTGCAHCDNTQPTPLK